ncbi:hypothetical protein Busp01_04810 [Trinickia caryophylli]|nr:hypothetical protein Busp01_04810 [Trinickia caryophylli]
MLLAEAVPAAVPDESPSRDRVKRAVMLETEAVSLRRTPEAGRYQNAEMPAMPRAPNARASRSSSRPIPPRA